MFRKIHISLATLLLVASFPAMASDFTGFVSLYLVVPILALSTALAGILYRIRRYRPQFRTKWSSVILFCPVLVLAVTIFFLDTILLLPSINLHTAFFPGSLLFGYIGLFAVLFYLTVLLIKDGAASEKMGSGESNVFRKVYFALLIFCYIFWFWFSVIVFLKLDFIYNCHAVIYVFTCEIMHRLVTVFFLPAYVLPLPLTIALLVSAIRSRSWSGAEVALAIGTWIFFLYSMSYFPSSWRGVLSNVQISNPLP